MDDVPLHSRATERAKSHSKRLRSDMSDEERLLWAELKHFRQNGWAFRKQAAIGPYIADFLCRKAMLIVEVDGRLHDHPDQIWRDTARTAYLERYGYRVIRFAAHEIWSQMDSVVQGIEHALQVPPPQGGGGRRA